MATVNQMLGKFKALNIENEAAQVLEDTEQELLTFNRNQLFRGEGADGKKLPRYPNGKYAEYKNALNPLPGLGVPDYKVSGDLYNQMAIDFKAGKLAIFSTVSYVGKVVARGGDPFGLQPSSKAAYVRINFNPRFVRNISSKTGTRVN